MGDTMTWRLKESGAGAILEIYDSPTEARSAKGLAGELAGLKASGLMVIITSAAGEASEALDVYDALRQWPGQLWTYTQFAAGGSSVIALAADKDQRLIAPDGVLFLEQPHVARVEDVTAVTRRIRSATASIAGVFSERIGWSADAWDDAMARTMWWQGQRAVDEGMVGGVVPADEITRITASAKTPASRTRIAAKGGQSEQRPQVPVGPKELGMGVRKAQAT